MLVAREDNPNKWEWVDEHYEKADYSSVYDEIEGVYKVYKKRNIIGKAIKHSEVEEMINEHMGVQ